MEQKRNGLLYGSVAMGVLTILAAVVCTILMTAEPTYTKLLEQGEKYFQRGSYDEAVKAFRTAIEKNEFDERAYLGLTKTYQELEYDALAQETLIIAWEKTAGDGVYQALEIYYPNIIAEKLQPSYEKALVSHEEEETPKWNETLAQFLSTGTYADYQSAYAEMNGYKGIDGYSCRPEGLKAALIFKKDRLDSKTGVPLPKSQPSEIIMDDICALFCGVKTLSIEALRALPGVSDVVQEEKEVCFTAFQCLFRVSCDENGTIYKGTENSIVPPKTVELGSHHIKGYVIDAVTGDAVIEAKVTASHGSMGERAECITDTFGYYEFYPEADGEYLLTVEKKGYISDSFSVYLTAGSTEITKDMPISPEMKQEQIRIVLTWAEKPKDLDSYLMGKLDDGTNVNVNYCHMVSGSMSNPYATLDVDDMDGYGPETTTLYRTDGVFDFAVVDYNRTGTMSQMGATVKIYRGSALVATASVPPVIDGWLVCRIDHGDVQILNATYGE